MRILLTNDDGVHAEGINVLKKRLEDEFEVITIAPLEERSTTGHTITLNSPLRVSKINNNTYGCSGYPADCVLMALGNILKDSRPDLIVSGINRGANLGQDTYYSGTVAAAREGVFHGVPSIAVSTVTDFLAPKDVIHYDSAAEIIYKIIKANLVQQIPQMGLLNINVPDLKIDEIKGLKMCELGFRRYSEDIDQRIDCRNRPYFWIGGSYLGHEYWDGSDCVAISEGYASITPINLINSLSEGKEAFNESLKGISIK